MRTGKTSAFAFLGLAIGAAVLLWSFAVFDPARAGPSAQATGTPRTSSYFPRILKNALPYPLSPTRHPPTRTPTPTATRTPSGTATRPAASVTPPPRPTSSMDTRLAAVLAVLERGGPCEAVDGALDEGMEILYGGLRPLPSKGLVEQTTSADMIVSANEMRMAAILEKFTRGARCEPQQARALDLKLFIEQMNEVALAVGVVTRRCGDGDSLMQPPCDELRPLLNEATGGETVGGPEEVVTIEPSFSVKLRGPAVPPWQHAWEEDVRVTEPIDMGQCVVIPKETRGLMLRLHFDRVILVADPWVTTFGVPRGTRVPIWRLEWTAAQYMKEWNLCNPSGTGIVKTVSQRVVQDVPLNFFWRFYRKDP